MKNSKNFNFIKILKLNFFQNHFSSVPICYYFQKNQNNVTHQLYCIKINCIKYQQEV